MSRQHSMALIVQKYGGTSVGSVERIKAVAAKVKRFRDRGGCVLLISADLDEILELADRVAVIYRGRLREPVARRAVNLEQLGRQMVGVAE